MNRKRIILLSLALFLVLNLFSQSVAYTYDDSGNRLTRTIVVQQQQSNSQKLPLVSQKSLKSTENVKGSGQDQSTPEVESPANANEKVQEDSLKGKTISGDEDIITHVYPNPNKGLLKVDITNMPLNSINEMRLYDLSGLELTVIRNFDSHSEIDISQFHDGIYILRIKIDERVFDWKVIKNHY